MEKKVERKTKKENEKKELLEKQKLLSQRWGMMKLVTEFIKDNQETWEKQEKRERIRNKLGLSCAKLSTA